MKKPQFENITPSSDQCDGARGVNLLGKLINEQTLTGTMSSMHKGGWKQWTKERPTWIHEDMKKVFWRFIDQKMRDTLNVAAAETHISNTGQEARKLATEGNKKPAHDN